MANSRTIIASFPSSTKAKTAAKALSEAGISDVHIKRNSRFGVTHDAKMNNPINQAETLTGLTLFSSNTSNDENSAARVLMAADPSVSGFSARGYGLAGGHAFTLVAFAPEERVDEAVGIIKQQGGDV
jgi:hypothetical protein